MIDSSFRPKQHGTLVSAEKKLIATKPPGKAVKRVQIDNELLIYYTAVTYDPVFESEPFQDARSPKIT